MVRKILTISNGGWVLANQMRNQICRVLPPRTPFCEKCHQLSSSPHSGTRPRRRRRRRSPVTPAAMCRSARSSRTARRGTTRRGARLRPDAPADPHREERPAQRPFQGAAHTFCTAAMDAAINWRSGAANCARYLAIPPQWMPERLQPPRERGKAPLRPPRRPGQRRGRGPQDCANSRPIDAHSDSSAPAASHLRQEGKPIVCSGSACRSASAVRKRRTSSIHWR